jgi:hypothetical protein
MTFASLAASRARAQTRLAPWVGGSRRPSYRVQREARGQARLSPQPQRGCSSGPAISSKIGSIRYGTASGSQYRDHAHQADTAATGVNRCLIINAQSGTLCADGKQR